MLEPDGEPQDLVPETGDTNHKLPSAVGEAGDLVSEEADGPDGVPNPESTTGPVPLSTPPRLLSLTIPQLSQQPPLLALPPLDGHMEAGTVLPLAGELQVTTLMEVPIPVPTGEPEDILMELPPPAGEVMEDLEVTVTGEPLDLPMAGEVGTDLPLVLLPLVLLASEDMDMVIPDMVGMELHNSEDGEVTHGDSGDLKSS